MARRFKMSMENSLFMLGLGPDGASPKAAYGQYHIDYMVKSMWLAEDLWARSFSNIVNFIKTT